MFALLLAGLVAAQPKPEPAAVVNGEVIPLADLDAVAKKRPPVPGPFTAAQARQIRLAVLDDLIDDVLLRQFLRKHAPAVTPAEVDAHLKGLAAAMAKQGKTLTDYYRDSGRTEAEVRDTFATLLGFEKYLDKQATDAELRRYHAANREFFDRVTVRVSHVVIRVGPTAPPAERAAAHQKLTAVRDAVRAGRLTFADAAKKYSMCPTAPAGGDLGWIARRDTIVDEAFAKAAFALPVGEVSPPTDTDFGVHLILAAERKPGTPTPYEKCAELVRDCYADDVRQSLTAALRQQADIKVTVP